MLVLARRGGRGQATAGMLKCKRPTATQPPCSLIPSPPGSPPRSPTLAPAAFSQLALKGEAREYVAPDHSRGEQFPGKQLPTSQLSLFETGFKRKAGQLSLFEAGIQRCSVGVSKK